MRYFIVFYVALNKSNGSNIIGQCTMKCSGGKTSFMNSAITISEINRLNLEKGIDIEQIVVTGFNEVTSDELEDWNT
jgi:hypothetical protein